MRTLSLLIVAWPLCFAYGASIDNDLCAGFSVYVYDLPLPPYVDANRQLFEMLDKGLDISRLNFNDKDLGLRAPFFMGMPCDDRNTPKSRDWANSVKCVSVRNGGMGRRRVGNFSSGNLPKGTVVYDTMPSSLPLLVLRYLLNNCQAKDAESASLFAVPLPLYSMVAATLSIKRIVKEGYPFTRTILPEISNGQLKAHMARMEKFVFEHPMWRRNGGRDHVVVIPSVLSDLIPQWPRIGFDHRKWAPATLVAIQATKAEGLAVPYPTVLHPRSDSEVDAWLEFLRSVKRDRAAVFVGKWHRRRDNFFKVCQANEAVCKREAAKDRFSATLEIYLVHEFSLQPAGETSTRRGFFESLLMGTIPIVYRRGPDPCTEGCPHMTIDGGRSNLTYDKVYSRYFDEGDGAWLKKVALVARDEEDAIKLLRKTSNSEISKLRENILRMIPSLLYWDTTYRWSQNPQKWSKYGSSNAVVSMLRALRDEMAKG